MKLPTSGYRLGASVAEVTRNLGLLLGQFAIQVNAASEERIAGAYNALTAPPTKGLYAQGDYIRNSAPTELGAAGSKYVVRGWICTAGGEPGTWVQDRGLTGA